NSPQNDSLVRSSDHSHENIITGSGRTRPTPKSLLGRLVCIEIQNCPRKRILTERLAHQRGEPVCTLSKINRFAGHQHPQARRNRDHVAAFTARSTSLSQPRSTPLCARTVAPAISITIDPGPLVAASAAP